MEIRVIAGVGMLVEVYTKDAVKLWIFHAINFRHCFSKHNLRSFVSAVAVGLTQQEVSSEFAVDLDSESELGKVFHYKLMILQEYILSRWYAGTSGFK